MRNTGSQWQSLRRTLEALATDVTAEIVAYPRPITACDAQFNHLLELRRLVPQELQRLEAAADDPGFTAEQFLRTSPCAAEMAALERRVAEPPSAASHPSPAER
jgi:hypothetical protein